MAVERAAVRFLIASSSGRTAAEASRLLGDLRHVECRQGSAADLGAECDAGIVHYPIAHDLYGGTPVVGQAQVLRNSRNDGAPPVILATAPLEAGAGMGPDREAEAENHACRMISMALAEWVRSPLYPHHSTEAVCLLHIEGAGLVFGDFAAIARGIRRAIEGHGDEPR